MKRGFMAAEAGKNKRAVWGVVLALLPVLLAACASETTPVPQPAPEATVIPAPAPTTSPIPTPDPTANLTVAPTRISGIQPTPSPTPYPREAIKSEVAAAVSQFGQALSTADTELMASLFLPSEKTNRFSSSEPLRINGWSEVEGSFKELLSLPPGIVSPV